MTSLDLAQVPKYVEGDFLNLLKTHSLKLVDGKSNLSSGKTFLNRRGRNLFQPTDSSFQKMAREKMWSNINKPSQNKGRKTRDCCFWCCWEKKPKHSFFINNRPFGLGTGQDIRILAKKKQKSQEGYAPPGLYFFGESFTFKRNPSTGRRTIIFVTFFTAFVLGWKWQKTRIFFFHALKVSDLIFWNFAYEYKSFTPWRARRDFLKQQKRWIFENGRRH